MPARASPALEARHRREAGRPPLPLLERILEASSREVEVGEKNQERKEAAMMRVRDPWLIEGHYLEEPYDWAVSPDLQPLLRREPPDDPEWRSLLEDPEALLQWGDSR